MSVKPVSYNEVSGAKSGAYLAMWSALNCFVAENQRSEPADFGPLSERLTAAGAMVRRAEELLQSSPDDQPDAESELAREYHDFQRRVGELQAGKLAEGVREYSTKLRSEGLRLSHEAVNFVQQSAAK